MSCCFWDNKVLNVCNLEVPEEDVLFKVASCCRKLRCKSFNASFTSFRRLCATAIVWCKLMLKLSGACKQSWLQICPRIRMTLPDMLQVRCFTYILYALQYVGCACTFMQHVEGEQHLYMYSQKTLNGIFWHVLKLSKTCGTHAVCPSEMSLHGMGLPKMCYQCVFFSGRRESLRCERKIHGLVTCAVLVSSEAQCHRRIAAFGYMLQTEYCTGLSRKQDGAWLISVL